MYRPDDLSVGASHACCDTPLQRFEAGENIVFFLEEKQAVDLKQAMLKQMSAILQKLTLPMISHEMSSALW